MINTNLILDFHIKKEIRDRYDLQDALFQQSGNTVLIHFRQSRELATKMNQGRDLVRYPEQAIKAGQLNAMGLIDEILHYISELYREEANSSIWQDALNHLENNMGKESIDKIINDFTDQFPALDVYKGKTSKEDYLAGKTADREHKTIVLEEILHLWLANSNPAFSPFIELFDDRELRKNNGYLFLINHLSSFFMEKLPFGPDNQPLIEMLLEPQRQFPDSLLDQLNFIREKWGYLLGKYLLRLLSSFDMISEEEKAFFGGPGPNLVPDYRDYEEYERFSADSEWMPKVVLLAKSTLVWLDQLSKQYKKEIHRLDQIPEEELALIASRGFTGLWLIGIWERSPASRRIKQICGNPEAEASAYALLDYQIAGELGGWEALKTLRQRCWNFGLRLASDMVPNHTGMDSYWIKEHPDWFMQLDHNPYPTYHFNGENLSHEPGLGIYLEDHYYNKSDCAVVFKRVDYNNNDTRYIYHGNDGTHMPWNDTAQINFLHPEAKEAVIQTILHVARNFPIIRFDAAMVLARKHIQRLWYPQPGQGGDIPSRAEHGMTRADFDKAMPQEFWREVVDRVAKEIPDTLLLAEAFWMLEGYFVRTLGMHRVYNSAFMNMLKAEENQKYRDTIKNTMNFDPQVLKRFVNFMNNPDEETADAQFGRDDKYFGVCTMMVTMPGLPMFGHGQIDGFREKYGMEYRKAYWEEEPDQGLILRHEKEIFPLMRLRYLFSGVSNFYLYDFWTEHGSVNENVFVYSNMAADKKALVAYNNAYQSTRGWIRTSTSYAVKDQNGNKDISQKVLSEALLLSGQENYFTLFYEQRSKQWFIRCSREVAEKGIYLDLQGYQNQVFMEFLEVRDNDKQHYYKLCSELQGSGVPNIDDALKEMLLRPLFSVFDFKKCSSIILDFLEDESSKRKRIPSSSRKELQDNLKAFLKKSKEFCRWRGNVNKMTTQLIQEIEGIPHFIKSTHSILNNTNLEHKPIQENSTKEEGFSNSFILAQWIIFHIFQKSNISAKFLDNWTIKRFILKLSQAIKPKQELNKVLGVFTSLEPISFPQKIKEKDYYKILKPIFSDSSFTSYIKEHRYNSVLYFHKESFEEFLRWFTILMPYTTLIHNEEEYTDKKLSLHIQEFTKAAESWKRNAEKSGYRSLVFLDNYAPPENKEKKKNKPEVKNKSNK